MHIAKQFKPIALAGAALAAALTASAAMAGSEEGRPHYLAAGDSVTFGHKATDPATTGYVPQVAAHLAPALTPGNAPAMPAASAGNYFGDVNTARLGSETTATMISGGQLAEAEAILRRHNQNDSREDDVEVVTFTVGGNDLIPLLGNPACLANPGSAQCQAVIFQALGAASINYHTIMSTLRDAAGDDAVIATMTYYNPLVGACTIPGPLGVQAGFVLAALNGIITATAAQYDILVAPVASAGLGVADMYGDCVHPNDSGYAKIAGAFESVIDPALP